MTTQKRRRGLPRVEREEVTGKLLVIEGTDGVGRSTQISMLVPWIETHGHAVVLTGWNRSLLVSKLITSAKEGTLLNKVTYTLLYATDFADRLERVVIPALKAGMVVIADRYVGTAFARAGVREVDHEWMRELYSFAPKPDLTIYMRLDVDELLPRTLDRTRLNYWESGMDQHMGEDIHDSFIQYQGRLVQNYDEMAKEFGWHVVDARRTTEHTQVEIRRAVGELLGIPSERVHDRLKPLTALVDEEG
ncbi:MAG: dTMP kinase [Candidatus Thermoplasmatota archaeon]